MARELIDIILRLRKEGTAGKDVAKELEGISKSAGQSETAFSKLKTSWGQFAAVGGAVTAGLYALKKAYDFGKEGAAILQTSESFDRLMTSMGKGPGVLQGLRDASRNTVDDMTLMSSTMTLLAGTSETLGSAIVDASPRLMEIAKAANKLNPALGDTAFLYQSLAQGIKRSSPMILDNLGLTIKVGDSQAAFARKIGKTVEQLTAEEKQLALLNAALEAGDRMIEQVGGSTEAAGDSFAEAEVKLKNAWDTIKTKLTPAVAELADSLANQLTPGAEHLVEHLEDSGWTARAMAESTNVARGEIDKFGTAAFRAADGTQVFVEAEDRAMNSSELLYNQLSYGIQAADGWAGAASRAAEATLDAAAAEDEFKASMDTLEMAIKGPVGEAFDEYMSKVAELDQQLAEGEITQAEYASSIDAVTEAYRENSRALAFNIAEKQILDALEKGLIEDTNASGTAFDEANTILWNLAETMGLTDEKTVNFMGSAQELTQALIDGKLTNQEYVTLMKELANNAEDATGKIDDVASSINNLPDTKRINIEVTTTYSGGTEFEGTEGEQGHGMGGGDAYNYQHGGQFVVQGPAGVDRVPVMFRATRGEVVTVTPVGGAPPPNPVTNHYNLNVTSTQPSMGITNDFNIMQALTG